jgi:hypothetical protein
MGENMQGAGSYQAAAVALAAASKAQSNDVKEIHRDLLKEDKNSSEGVNEIRKILAEYASNAANDLNNASAKAHDNMDWVVSVTQQLVKDEKNYEANKARAFYWRQLNCFDAAIIDLTIALELPEAKKAPPREIATLHHDLADSWLSLGKAIKLQHKEKGLVLIDQGILATAEVMPSQNYTVGLDQKNQQLTLVLQPSAKTIGDPKIYLVHAKLWLAKDNFKMAQTVIKAALEKKLLSDKEKEYLAIKEAIDEAERKGTKRNAVEPDAPPPKKRSKTNGPTDSNFDAKHTVTPGMPDLPKLPVQKDKRAEEKREAELADLQGLNTRLQKLRDTKDGEKRRRLDKLARDVHKSYDFYSTAKIPRIKLLYECAILKWKFEFSSDDVQDALELADTISLRAGYKIDDPELEKRISTTKKTIQERLKKKQEKQQEKSQAAEDVSGQNPDEQDPDEARANQYRLKNFY